MEKLTNDISEIIISEANAINPKILELNFLELLKSNIIEKLVLFLNQHKFPLEKSINYEKEIKDSSRNFAIYINYFINSIFINKKKLDNDSMFLSFNETSSFDVYKDVKTFRSFLLYKNTGISLPKNTVINSKYNKGLLLVKINNKEIE